MSTPSDHDRVPRQLARGALLALAAVLLLLGLACQSTTSAAGGSAASTTTAVQGGGAATAPKSPQATVAQRKPAPGPADAKPSGPAGDDRERIAARATWAPGSLESHFEEHGAEGPYRSAAEYDAAARETIRVGTRFTYQDRESNAERLGFYDKAGNRFTGVTRDGGRITTHFRPNRGEAYVRGLERSTYR